MSSSIIKTINLLYNDNKMKIAIVHDWLVTNAGAEKVLKSILELYPSADIYSLVDFLDSNSRDNILSGKYATTSFIQKLPFAKKHFRNYLPLFPMAIESFDLSNYNLIISSSWAVAKGVKTNKQQTHICYCHTPIRYAWDLYDEYTSNLSFIKKIVVKQTLKRLKKWDLATLDRVDHFIANSNFVKARIQNTYSRNSTVIYPPVDINKFTLQSSKEDFYITASRLVPYKKTKLIVDAFNKMPDKKLVVIGSGDELESIKKISQANISVLGYQPDQLLVEHIQKAKAFIYAAIEDFGILPIEAMACGTPVIALNKGGTAETVIDGVNGVHFQEQATQEICSAVDKFELTTFNPSNVRDIALNYTHFKSQIKIFIDSKCRLT